LSLTQSSFLNETFVNRLTVQERPPDSWLPFKKWDAVSPECESSTAPLHSIKRPMAVGDLLVPE
jgi:hypothetical protein